MSDICNRFISDKYADLRKMNQEGIDEMMGDIEYIRKNTTSESEFKKKVHQYLKESSESFVLNQDTVIRNAALMNNNMERVFSHPKGPLEGLASILAQTNFMGKNQGVNIEAIQKVHRAKYTNMLQNNLKQSDFKLLSSRSIEPELIRALSNPSYDANPDVKRIAGVWRKVIDIQHADKVRAGIPIGYQKNYIVNQSLVLNADTFSKLGPGAKEDFIQTAMKAYDLEKSFPFLAKEDIPQYFDDLFEGLMEKRKDRLSVDFSNLKTAPDLIKGKLLRRNLHARKLVFNDGGFELMWGKYADRSLVGAMVDDMHKTATDIAAYQVLGANGLSGFDTLKQKVARKMVTDKVPEETINEITGPEGELDRIMRTLDGFADRVANHTVAAIDQNLRSLESSAILGGASLSSLTDVVTSVGMLSAATNQSYLKSFTDIFSEIIPNYPGFIKEAAGRVVSKEMESENRETAEILSVAIEHGLGDMTRKLGIGDGYTNPILRKFSEATASINEFMNKINPLSTQASFHRKSAVMVYSQNLQRQLSNSWEKLDSFYTANFERVGLSSVDWDSMKYLQHNERKIFSGAYAHKIPDDVALKAIASHKEKMGKFYTIKTPDDYRFDMELKANVLLENFGSYAAPDPGVRARAALLRGTQAGTLPGTLMRSLALLKCFSVQMFHVQQRILNSDPSGKKAYKLMTANILGMWGAGYTVMALKSVLNNETPPDPTNPKTSVEAFVRSGAGGLYSDFLLNQTGKGMGGTVVGLAGPMASMVEDIGTAKLKLAEEVSNLFSGKDKGGFKPKDISMLTKHIPGNNLWYLNTALKWSILDEVKEELNPGHKKRMSKRLHEREGLLWEQGKILE